MIRVLVVGAATFEADVPAGEWNPAVPGGYTSLPAVLPAVRGLARAFSRLENVELIDGAPLVDPDHRTVQTWWQEVRQRNNGPLVVCFTGHGVAHGQTLYLPVSDTDPARLPDTSINVSQWLDTIEHTDSAVPTLFLFDVCHAGSAVWHQISQRVGDTDRKAWLIASCAPDEKAFGARFTAALATVLDRLREGRLHIAPSLRYAPLETIASEVDRELARRSRPAELPQTVFRTPSFVASGREQPFFVNPGHTEDPYQQLRQTIDTALRELTDVVIAGLDPEHFVTRAIGTASWSTAFGACFFTGRVGELRTVGEWLAGDGSLLMITGSPGAGKSALLGVVTCLCHPQLRRLSPPIRARLSASVRHIEWPSPFAAVHARARDVSDVVTSFAAQLGLAAPPADAERIVDFFANQLATLPQPPVLVIDAVDESLDSRTLVDDFIAPLLRKRASDRPLCRIMVGVRPWWDQLEGLRYAASRGVVIDLDSSTPAEELATDLATYLEDILAAGPGYDRAVVMAVGRRLARSAGRFLLASLFARYLDRHPGLSIDQAIAVLPADLPGMFRLHMESSPVPWLRPVLTVVANAKGQGIPLELIHHCLPDGAEEATIDDVRQAVTEAVFYLRTDTDVDGRLLYRLFHQSLIDHFHDEAGEAVMTDRLLSTVIPGNPVPAWHSAFPYVLRHVLDHAASGSATIVNRLLTDPAFLVHADPAGVVRNLDRATSVMAQRHGSVYAGEWLGIREANPARRKQLLAFSAARQDHRDLVSWLRDVVTESEPPPLEPRWVTGAAAQNLLLVFEPATAEAVTALAVGRGGTGPVVVVGGRGGTVDVHDALDGSALFSLDCHDEPILAIETLDRGDLSIAVVGSASRIRVSSLNDGFLFAEYEDPDLGLVALGAFIDEDSGAPVACVITSAGDLMFIYLDDGEVRALQSGLPADILAVQVVARGDELMVRTRCADDYEPEAGVAALALSEFEGQPVEVVGLRDSRIELWRSEGDDFLCCLHSYEGVSAVIRLSRWPRENGHISTVHTVGLRTEEVVAVALGRARGIPIVVGVLADNQIRVWDVSYRAIVGLGHNEDVSISILNRRPGGLVVADCAAQELPCWNDVERRFQSVLRERRVRAWEMDTGEEIFVDGIGALEESTTRSRTPPPNVDTCVAWAGGALEGRGELLVSVERNGAVMVREATTGEYLGGPLRLPVHQVYRAAIAMNERGVAICYDGEIAMLEWALGDRGGLGGRVAVPFPAGTHIAVWVPAEFSVEREAVDRWDLYALDSWESGKAVRDPEGSLAAPVDVEPDVMLRCIATVLDSQGRDVIELEATSLVISFDGDQVQDRSVPAFVVVTQQRPRVTR
ncbi:ATP-binding protein [Amycolatopsis vancoresmycina]|nr:ATP-binding protein [Amycolatopsis vancoresmycina]